MDAFEIERVRAHRARAGPGADGVRLRLASLLGRADLHPPGVPPSAVLIVRRLADPLPGHLLPTSGLPRADAGWERAVRAVLTGLYATAVRPSRGWIPDSAEAVRFDDEGELLACLALDLARGRASACWWWRTLLRRLPHHAPPLVALLHTRADRFPAAVHHLAVWDQTEPVLASLAPGEAQALSAPVVEAFGLAALRRALAEPAPRVVSEVLMVSPIAWPERLIAVPMQARLGPARSALLALGLTLYRRPGHATSADFEGAWRHAWHLTPSDGTTASQPATAVLPTDSMPLASPGSSSRPPAPLPPQAPPAPGSQVPPPSPGRTARSRPFVPAPSRSAPQPATRAPSDLPDPPTPIAPPEPGLATHSPGPATSEVDLGHGVPTHLGGLLYLINVMTHLGLPGCFEPEWRLASALGPWGTLEALARALLDDLADAHSDDAIWGALATLDGRDPSLPLGHGLAAPDAFRLPSAWLDGEPTPKLLYWAATRSRFQVWTEDGVLLADEPRRGLPTDHLADVLRTLGLAADACPRHLRRLADSPAVARIGGDLAAVAPPLLRWLGGVLPFIRHRLASALGLPPGDRLARALVAPGTLYVTASHVDLVLPLDAISLPVRRAGLDRDPGWLPSYGRVVLFHFT